jgi:hypothetical protein
MAKQGAEIRSDRQTFLPLGAVPRARLQLVLGNDRAEVPLDNLERLENRPLKGLNFYMLVNRENWQLAPLEPGGSPTPTLDAVRKVIQLIARLPEFGSLEPISPVALAWQTSYARDAYAAPATDKGRKLPYEMTVGAFAELACAGYLPRIWITEEPPPADAAAIVTPAGSYMERDICKSSSHGAGSRDCRFSWSVVRLGMTKTDNPAICSPRRWKPAMSYLSREPKTSPIRWARGASNRPSAPIAITA